MDWTVRKPAAVSLVTAASLLLHAVLGCCWHHAHVLAGQAERSHHEHRPSAISHSADESSLGPCRDGSSAVEAVWCTGCEHSHHPCDHGRCAAIENGNGTARSVESSTEAWLATAQEGSQVAWQPGTGRRFLPPVRFIEAGNRRARLQVWLL